MERAEAFTCTFRNLIKRTPKLIPNTLLKELYRNHREEGKEIMQDNHMCTCVLSPAMILCAAVPLSPSTAQHWPVSLWEMSALGYSSLLPWSSALNSSSILQSPKAEIGMHTQHTPITWKQYFFFCTIMAGICYILKWLPRILYFRRNRLI